MSSPPGLAMILPRSITITDFDYFLDGGSVTLHAVTEDGEKFRVQLNQRMFLTEPYPGRLMLNDEVVGIRTETETRILELLKNSRIEIPRQDITFSPEPAFTKDAFVIGDDIRKIMVALEETRLRKMRDRIVEFAESQLYVHLAITQPTSSRGRR